MKRATSLVAIIGTGLILVCVLIRLALSSQENELCRMSLLETGQTNHSTCEIFSSPTIAPSNQPTPTLAPPRPEPATQNEPLSSEVANGQPVFLKVETNQHEIEIGWAAP
jgi:hypothetical protein